LNYYRASEQRDLWSTASHPGKDNRRWSFLTSIAPKQILSETSAATRLPFVVGGQELLQQGLVARSF